ncbi:MAG: iron-sulfur cluster assembly accessory protein [Deltaproteobacteria bacterium]|nr:iron-sulfur cluster assembly accessory protein [Deltaproteobacteria bacterium]
MEATATAVEAPAAPLRVTPRAVQKAREQLQKRGTPGAMLRLGVRGGGCSGFAYVLEFADETRLRDQVFDFDGVRLVVDPKSLVFLRGVTLDYETKLMSHGFKFVNPNEASGCGCGESFSV